MTQIKKYQCTRRRLVNFPSEFELAGMFSFSPFKTKKCELAGELYYKSPDLNSPGIFKQVITKETIFRLCYAIPVGNLIYDDIPKNAS